MALGYGDVGPGDQIQSLAQTCLISYITPGPEIESELVQVLWPWGMGMLNLMTRFSYTTLIPVTTQFRKSLNHQRCFHCKNKCFNTSLNAWGFPKCQLVCVLHGWKECCYIRQTVWNWWFSCFEIWLCCLRVKNVHNWLWMNNVFCSQHKFQTLAK